MTEPAGCAGRLALYQLPPWLLHSALTVIAFVVQVVPPFRL
jgi:hypothetical protein